MNRSLVIALLSALVLTRAAGKDSAIQYNRDVRPILSENCFVCHGADAGSRKAKLRLDSFEEATASRNNSSPAIVPGKPQQSEAVRRIFDAGDDIMPPEQSHKKLTPEQKNLLKRWIADGAKYEPHWAFITPERPVLPKVKNERWVRNPIDKFILARLEQEKLPPSKEADRRTLIRRVTLDLTGLPPTPEEADAFVADNSPDAYEKVVDRLLSSPRWGEHRARYWLDAARYADTHGIHFDNYREIWPYREWVIKAFNQNMPFDQFTIENLAGDLLPNATRDQKIGSGFNRCNITTSEGGAIDEEYLVLYARDRTETTSQVWLGLTAGCAVCHDHKYDPFSQKDFYSLSAFFNNTTQKAMDGNVRDTAPVVFIPKPEDETRWSSLVDEITGVEKKIAERKESAHADYTNWLAQPDFASLAAKVPCNALVLHAPMNEGGTEIFAEVAGSKQPAAVGLNTNWQAGAISEKAYTAGGKTPPTFPAAGDFERTNAFSYAVWVRVAEDRSGACFARMENKDGKYRGWDLWLTDGKPAFHLIHQWPQNTVKITAKKPLPKDRWNHVCVTYDGSSKARGAKIYVNSELQESDVNNDSLTGTTRTTAPLKLGQRDSGEPVENVGLQDLKIFARELQREEIITLMAVPRLNWLASRPEDKRNNLEAEESYSLWLAQVDSQYPQLVAKHDTLKAEEKTIRQRGAVTHVMQEKASAPEAYVLFRGDYDKRRDRVTPNTPAALPPMSASGPRDRLGFAQWLLQPQNPLTARVTVNRFWQELFGTGIVRTTGDFGVAGEMPSHPELLDWLAVEFRESGWDMKRFYKLLVTSATYRQSSVVTRQHLASDPQNRLLARGPRFRMDAEMIRDYALAASGTLVERVGGPSVRPYQPPGLWEVVGMPESDTRKYRQDTGENLYRRSVYSFWKRMSPPASMEIFNAPSREVCTVRRERTDTPLQALVTLNDPQFVEAARNLAQLSLQRDQSGAAAIDFMARRLLARPLTAEEMKIVEAGRDDLLAHYRQAPKDAADLLKVGESKPDARLDVPTLATYTMVANSLMNMDEVLNK